MKYTYPITIQIVWIFNFNYDTLIMGLDYEPNNPINYSSPKDYDDK